MKTLNNPRGMILVIAIAFTIVLAVIIIGFMSRNSSQIITAEQQSKRLKAEAVLQGAIWRAYTIKASGGTPSNYTESVDGVNFNISYTITPGAGVGGTDIITARVNY